MLPLPLHVQLVRKGPASPSVRCTSLSSIHLDRLPPQDNDELWVSLTWPVMYIDSSLLILQTTKLIIQKHGRLMLL